MQQTHDDLDKNSFESKGLDFCIYYSKFGHIEGFDRKTFRIETWSTIFQQREMA
jgi:hypothetical protein